MLEYCSLFLDDYGECAMLRLFLDCREGDREEIELRRDLLYKPNGFLEQQYKDCLPTFRTSGAFFFARVAPINSLSRVAVEVTLKYGSRSKRRRKCKINRMIINREIKVA